MVLVGLGCSSGIEHRDSTSVPDSSYVMQRLGGNALVVRRGFRVSLFADGLDGVRFMTVGPDGQVYASITTRCDQAIGPVIRFPAHSAPLGLAFYTGSTFPEEYHGDLFVALHGSWDRSFPTGYKVVRIPMNGAQPTGDPQDFVTGWQMGRGWWGRPVDVLVAPDGSLLISDDFGGRVFRVS